jgi:hypothetical protein
MPPPKCSMLEGLIPLDEDAATVKEPSPAPCAASAPSLFFMPAHDGMQRSLDMLNATSHDIRLRLAADERADKGTNGAYARHVRNYVLYWDQHQCEMVAQDPAWTSVPAMPITAAKAVIFLNQERTREKVGLQAACSCTATDEFIYFLFSGDRDQVAPSLALTSASLSSSRPSAPSRTGG